MLDSIFSLDKFNTYSDNEYYYFFRALNMADNDDIENEITISPDGKIIRIRTDLDRYEGIPTYSKDSMLSLREVFDHIKMHQDKSTNCISLTSNANTAITYGRGNYKDRYVMIKVPKEEIGKNVFEAGLFMLQEINREIALMVERKELSKPQIELLELIDRVRTEEQLQEIKEKISPQKRTESSDYEEGLVKKITESQNYLSLNGKQNFEKNRIILKLDVLSKNLLKGVSNSFLIQTIGNAFSSLELIHYKEISGERIIELPKELIDIFAIIQQLPSDLENVSELKHDVIRNSLVKELNGSYELEDFQMVQDVLTLDNIYELTQGKISYDAAITMYKKAYYYAKSRLRANDAINLLKTIVGNDSKYEHIFNYMEENIYGIEPELTTRITSNKVQVSESVSLDFSSNELELFNYLSSLSLNQLNYIVKNPKDALNLILSQFITDKFLFATDKETWYANSIIDLLDFDRLGVTNNLSNRQRQDIIKALKRSDFLEKYYDLKSKGLEEKDIANALFTSLIRNKDEIDLNETFSLEELEYFIGYNRIKGTNLNLRSYQRLAVTNINKTFETKKFTSAILPTGSGKSFVALAEMNRFKDEKILYLAPNQEILNQIVDYIKIVYNPEEHLGDSDLDIIRRVFPNLTLATYQSLKEESSKEIIKDNYSLIVFDELHRTGAKEWNKHIRELIDNQENDVKILGITATPERDIDFQNMTNYWASYLGYSDEEIRTKKHIAIDMDIIEAIKLGYIVNPKIISCEYSLISDGSLDEIKLSIDEIADIELYKQKIVQYEKLRRNVESSSGIEKILHDNLREGGKYIVFLPVMKGNSKSFEDEDGYFIDESIGQKKASAGIIKVYEALMKQFLYSAEFFEHNQTIIDIYNKLIVAQGLTDADLKYLQDNKESILILSKIPVNNMSLALNTHNDVVIKTIIEYMDWPKLQIKDQMARLDRLMADKVSSYSMLGSYGAKKNKDNLDGFNEDTSSKYKFMFVMNKLNEGVHIDEITGIIWLRPLDENSKILYLQQLGRCIYAIMPNIKVTDEERPVVFDFVNNTLKVRLDKLISSREDQDLANFYIIKNWIEDNNRLPEENTYDELESELYKQLQRISRNYRKYSENPNLLGGLEVGKKVIVEALLKEGENYDIWNIPLDNASRSKTEAEEANSNIRAFFAVKPIIKDFVELSDELEEYEYTRLDKWLKVLEDIYQNKLYDINGHELGLDEISHNSKVRKNPDGTYTHIKPIRKNGKVTNSKQYMEKGLIPFGFWLVQRNNILKIDDELLQRYGLLDKRNRILKNRKILEVKPEPSIEMLMDMISEEHHLRDKNGNIIDLDALVATSKVRINSDGTYTLINQIKRGTGILNEDEYKDKSLISIGSWLIGQNNIQGISDTLLEKLGLLEKKKQLSKTRIILETKLKPSVELLVDMYGKLRDKDGNPLDLDELTYDSRVRVNEDGTYTLIKPNRKAQKVDEKEYKDRSLIAIGVWLIAQNNLLNIDPIILEQIGLLEKRNNIMFSRKMRKEKLEPSLDLLIDMASDEHHLRDEDGNILPLDVLAFASRVRKEADGTYTLIKTKYKDGKIINPEYKAKDLIHIGSWLFIQNNILEIDDSTLEQIGLLEKRNQLVEIRNSKKSKPIDFVEMLTDMQGKLEDRNGNPISLNNITSQSKIRKNTDGTYTLINLMQNGVKVEEYYKDPTLINLGAWLFGKRKNIFSIATEKLAELGLLERCQMFLEKYANDEENFVLKSKFAEVKARIESSTKKDESEGGISKKTNGTSALTQFTSTEESFTEESDFTRVKNKVKKGMKKADGKGISGNGKKL